MNELMMDQQMERNAKLKIIEMERNVEKETITTVIAPSCTEKRNEIHDFVINLETQKIEEFNNDLHRFINTFKDKNNGMWVDSAMNEMEKNIQKFNDFLH
ncbi:hypothetical protein [Macrococcoides canis]|uniref:hypothetical protein n=1 Tax=Macrococcoides canis TaxID=1855823 RepID=UPI001F167622|nr:hypothetical protein [Macrococcus canis]UJS27242.1 hypothetical protein L2Z53_08665 [Macrococcus canis]WBF53431.1 hypothetical protein LL975_03815 [Macrococcus canis]